MMKSNVHLLYEENISAFNGVITDSLKKNSLVIKHKSLRSLGFFIHFNPIMDLFCKKLNGFDFSLCGRFAEVPLL